MSLCAYVQGLLAFIEKATILWGFFSAIFLELVCGKARQSCYNFCLVSVRAFVRVYMRVCVSACVRSCVCPDLSGP